MSNSHKHLGWACTAAIAVLAIGSPAYADDVELLLTSTTASSAAKPNILFILDSSGSMTSIDATQELYDPSTTYAGGCNRNYYYWSTSGGAPNCGNNNRIRKTSFVCASGIDPAKNTGSFTDTMAQYRGNNSKWQRLSSSDDDSLVECKSDSGVHGQGTSGQVYARIGNNQALFTNDSSKEVDWGSNPTDRTYTMYDGNFLNWYHYPPMNLMSRTDIVKEVTKNLLDSMSNVNVGFMRFHNDQGGPVVHALKDLDSNRSAARSVVDNLPASGWTPLSETMYEAALYWRGMGRYYGALSSTDPDALVPGDDSQYQPPTVYACAKNFTVLLTDGDPTQDVHANSRAPQLPNFSTVMGSSVCDGGNGDGVCLDDIAAYLSKEDINPNIPGSQTVTTYTIGFKVDLPLLRDTAYESGGEYYLAEDVQSLTAALTDIVTNIFERDISFTAPAVAVNAFNRTQHLNDLYMAVFRATDRQHWPGNVKKYRIGGGVVKDSNDIGAIDPDTGFFAENSKSFWTPGTNPDGANVNLGGALSQLPDPDLRRLFTNINGNDLTTPGNSISVSNIGNFTPSDFGLSGATGEPSMTQLISWARGYDVKDADNNPLTTHRRAMGDTLHSQPAAIVYDSGPTYADMDIVVFSATNDGYLHAINGKTGAELWSFVPKELLNNLGDLYINNHVDFKNYGIDGALVPVVIDRNDDGKIEAGTDSVYLVFGMRRGGNNFYALDVTDKNTPKLKWIKTFAQFGQSWSTPVIARIKTTGAGATSTDDGVVVLGAGYSTAHDQAQFPSVADAEGAGIFMLDLETGNELWRAGPDASADLQLSKMTSAIPTRVSVLDMTADGYADRMYASDLGGQIWRFDIKNGANPAGLVAGGVMAQLGAAGQTNPTIADTRRFYTSPDVSMITDHALNQRFVAISLGSGYRAHPLDKRNEDRFYSLRDPNVFNSLTQAQYNALTVTQDSNLVEVSGQVGVKLTAGSKGWKFTVPAGEKVLSDSQTFDNSVYFVTFEPETSNVDPCQAGLSVNRLYRVSVVNGDPVVDFSTIDLSDPVAVDDARGVELVQGGIAPRPTFLFPHADDPDNCKGAECTPDPIGCVGVECFTPDFANSPVRTLWTQDGIE